MKLRHLLIYWWVPVALAIFVLVIGWLIAMNHVFHDKAVNADALQRLGSYGRKLPMRTVIPAHNHWTDKAFIAEPSKEEAGRDASVLILDDHYRGDDPTYRTESGIIGDELSLPVLCSVPVQAANKGVSLDPVVLRMIRSKCINAH